MEVRHVENDINGKSSYLFSRAVRQYVPKMTQSGKLRPFHDMAGTWTFLQSLVKHVDTLKVGFEAGKALLGGEMWGETEKLLIKKLLLCLRLQIREALGEPDKDGVLVHLDGVRIVHQGLPQLLAPEKIVFRMMIILI